jgi:lipopolysaccharide export system protein LptA
MLIRTSVQTAAFALILSGSAFAQTTQVIFGGMKSDTSLPVEMVSDSLTINQGDSTALFSGDAVVTQGEMKLSAKTLFVEYSQTDKAVKTITADGKVLLVNATDAAEADHAVYTVATGKVVLTGKVLMTQGQAAISAQSMVIDLTTGPGQMEGRVTTTFVPGKKK